MTEPNQLSLHQALSYDDDASVDSNFDPEIPTIKSTGSADALSSMTTTNHHGVFNTVKYDAATIRAEFKTYQSILPRPDELLQQHHSFAYLRREIKEANIELPRFLQYKNEGGIKPHHALCCLLLSEYERGVGYRKENVVGELLVKILSFGQLHNQLNNPADFIRDQFYRVAPFIPTDRVPSAVLRKMVRNRGMPVPNYFLDPEDEKQLPPHIALLVMLHDGERGRSRKLEDSLLNRVAFFTFALTALLLRIVLEVVGGAGAIWGGAEVVRLRHADNAELWRWISVGVGVLCYLRFATLNLPQREDEGGILGPAGPWSLRLPARLRAVCDHPFHYFMRALPPSSPGRKKEE